MFRSVLFCSFAKENRCSLFLRNTRCSKVMDANKSLIRDIKGVRDIEQDDDDNVNDSGKPEQAPH